ncbi:glycerate kinase [Proteiniclasticum sp.]|uniref:glycerate kinase type-2 family protein n=1 Tax=Proteiniclasticum sp. TaxID=2053595 RepID=UPI0028A01DF5|nr:glycerate kinase [Proteiniclasticum sp.]
MNISRDARGIIDQSIKSVKPDAAVISALEDRFFGGKVVIIAIGKAAFNMADAAYGILADQVTGGVVITKYGHAEGTIGNLDIVEAGHPIVDHNSVKGTKKVLEVTEKLGEKDHVIFLVSGGGSALFELPMEGVELEEIMDITDQLLKSGADIVEINTVRKHLSKVKGGKFAEHCRNTNILSIVLSDVIGDPLDAIASGPAYKDSSTSAEALDILRQYQIMVEPHILDVLKTETPKDVRNCETVIAGSVTALCRAAEEAASEKGYTPYLLSSTIDCEAREAGRFFSAIAREIRNGTSSFKAPCAIIAGGETVVKIKGSGLGGRNQELALSCAQGIEGLRDTLFFSVGSDGTDGPTDAAGGIVDGETAAKLRDSGIPLEIYLDNNDSYHALDRANGLIMTGPTGTNVNDLMVLLVSL